MKALVINEFVDKHTGELHTKGSSFSCDAARFKDIQTSGNYVQEVPESKADKKK